MPSTPFPTTLADLNFHDPDSTTLYRSIKAIRKSTLSISNRLTSILQDSNFVHQTAQAHDLPLIANERCGSWYIDPSLKVGSAYFKSTDGHHSQWGFSLRRLNLHALTIIGKHGGAVIVDSTRRGKNMPDALLKTIPIWVAVMNRVLFPEKIESHALQCPPTPDELGESEKLQIKDRLPRFVESFLALGLDVQALRQDVAKPLRIVWEVHGVSDLDLESKGHASHAPDLSLVVLCSASRRVTGAEVSARGYIQGAGDDSEGWSCGLTPQLFWQHKEYLLGEVLEEDLLETIQRLVTESSTRADGDGPVLIKQTNSLFIAEASPDLPKDGIFDLTIHCNRRASSGKPSILPLACRSGKLGSRDLRERLQAVKDHAVKVLSRKPAAKVLVTCETGKDLSVGVALLLLCLFYDDDGTVNKVPPGSGVDKSFIKKRLAWISSSMPWASPSRATLQSVHAFLMERP